MLGRPRPGARSPFPPKPPRRSRPFPRTNLLLLSIDTLRRDHLSFYGYERPTAPNLARLAREGIVFEDAVAAHTQTAPSHASVLTGLYPGTHGILRNGMRLDEEARTLQEMLRVRGWRTAAFLSGWTLGRETGLDAGFEVYEVPLNRDRRRRPADETWPEVERWLLRRSPPEQPFFLFVHLYDPHFRYVPPEEYALRFLPPGTQLRPRGPGRDPRAAAVPEPRRGDPSPLRRALRRGDRLRGSLRGPAVSHARGSGRLGSDPGGLPLGPRRDPLRARPPRGSRGTGVRGAGPHPAGLPPAARGARRPARRLARCITWTCCPPCWSSWTSPPPRGFRGVPWCGGSKARPTRWANAPLYSQAESKPNRVPHISARLVRDKLVWAIRLGRFKLIEYPTHDGAYLELFDLEEDPGETRNLASVDPERAAQLAERLERWRAEIRPGDAGPLPELDPETESGLRALGYVD